MTYDIHKKSSRTAFSIKNRTTGNKFCTIDFSSGCCSVGFKIEFADINRTFDGKFVINGNESW